LLTPLHAKPQVPIYFGIVSLFSVIHHFPPSPRHPFRGSQASAGCFRNLLPLAFYPQTQLAYSLSFLLALHKKSLCHASRRTRLFEGSGDEAIV